MSWCAYIGEIDMSRDRTGAFVSGTEEGRDFATEAGARNHLAKLAGLHLINMQGKYHVHSYENLAGQWIIIKQADAPADATARQWCVSYFENPPGYQVKSTNRRLTLTT